MRNKKEIVEAFKRIAAEPPTTLTDLIESTEVVKGYLISEKDYELLQPIFNGTMTTSYKIGDTTYEVEGRIVPYAKTGKRYWPANEEEIYLVFYPDKNRALSRAIELMTAIADAYQMHWR